jgi:hypothetical protein
MDKNNSSNKLIIILLVILLAAIIGAIIITAYTVNTAIQTAVSPIQDVNDTLSTQIADLLHPTPTVIPDPVTIIREVQSLARLETIQFSVEKIITAEVNQGVFGPLFGDKLLFVAHGYVIAGIDLAKIETDDLWLEENALHVNLPDAEVFVVALNNDESYIYDRETGILRQSDPDLETAARQAAEDEILNAALEDGILLQAEQNAEIYLERLFNSLGYLQVVFE